MRIVRCAVPAHRALSPREFERLLQRAEIFQELRKLHGPQLVGTPRPSLKRSAPAARNEILHLTLPFAL